MCDDGFLRSPQDCVLSHIERGLERSSGGKKGVINVGSELSESDEKLDRMQSVGQ